METQRPEQIFRRPALVETPNKIIQPISRQETINAYNSVFMRFAQRGNSLEERLRNNEFQALGSITEKVNSGEDLTLADRALVEDYRQLLDTHTARHGRRNLNIAHHFEEASRAEALGGTLSFWQKELKQEYQAGRFENIPASDHMISNDVLTDRFVVPVKDGDQSFAIVDGAPVEGMLQYLDVEIAQIKRLEPNRENQRLLSNCRRERDVLFTQSTAIFSDEGEVFHARDQLEAYYNSIDPLKNEWHLPDWFNGENVLRDRRVLDIPPAQLIKYKNRWAVGCLPVLLLIPFVCGALNLVAAPCYGVGEGETRGELQIENFIITPGQQNSIEGSILRELGRHELGKSQFEKTAPDDPETREVLDSLRESNPAYLNKYLEVANKDYSDAGKRIRADDVVLPWIESTNFERQESLPRCLTPEQREAQAKRLIEEERNPQWYNPIRNFVNNLRFYLPNLNINIK